MLKNNRSIGIWLISAVAVVFGLLTIKSGGSVLFIDGVDRQAAGNYVPFVLWFNFIAGFFYIMAGVGLWLQKPWAARLSIVIVVTTLIVYAALGLFIFSGGLYETRTIMAMALRSILWTFIAIFSYWKLIRQ